MPNTENFEVHLKNVRLAFQAIFEAKPPKDNPQGEKTFSASFLFPKSDKETYGKVKAAIQACAKAKWGENMPKLKPEKFCMRDGDLESYDGFPGNWYVASRSKTRPTVLDRNRKPLVAADGKPYSGCYVNAVVRIWAQDNDYGKRINASLEGVQFVKDGDAFGKTPLSEDAFEDLGDSEFEDSGASEGNDDEIPF